MEFKDAWDCAKLEEEEDFSGGSCGKYQQRLWDLFDKPHTSIPARVGRTSLIQRNVVKYLMYLADSSHLLSLHLPLRHHPHPRHPPGLHHRGRSGLSAVRHLRGRGHSLVLTGVLCQTSGLPGQEKENIPMRKIQKFKINHFLDLRGS